MPDKTNKKNRRDGVAKGAPSATPTVSEAVLREFFQVQDP